MASAGSIIWLVLEIIAKALAIYEAKSQEPEVLVYDGKGVNAGAVNRARAQWNDRLRALRQNAAKPAAASATGAGGPG